MKILITLKDQGGHECHRHTIDVGDDDLAERSERIHEAMAGWTLAPGDVIRIEDAS